MRERVVEAAARQTAPVPHDAVDLVDELGVVVPAFKLEIGRVIGGADRVELVKENADILVARGDVCAVESVVAHVHALTAGDDEEAGKRHTLGVLRAHPAARDVERAVVVIVAFSGVDIVRDVKIIIRAVDAHDVPRMPDGVARLIARHDHARYAHLLAYPLHRKAYPVALCRAVAECAVGVGGIDSVVGIIAVRGYVVIRGELPLIIALLRGLLGERLGNAVAHAEFRGVLLLREGDGQTRGDDVAARVGVVGYLLRCGELQQLRAFVGQEQREV